MMKTTLLTISLLVMGVTGTAGAQSRVPLAPNAPADRPVSVRAECEWKAAEAAMAPYVAQARKTYPAARQKYLAGGAPARPMFVTTRLTDSTGRREQVFVRVDSIAGPAIFGSIASQVQVVRGYRYRQAIRVEEANLLDWMFANPDGSEEGNVVGNFMDTYSPPRSCGEA